MSARLIVTVSGVSASGLIAFIINIPSIARDHDNYITINNLINGPPITFPQPPHSGFTNQFRHEWVPEVNISGHQLKRCQKPLRISFRHRLKLFRRQRRDD